ncbi:epsin-2-like isoform X2 [Glandiceps talaboti]
MPIRRQLKNVVNNYSDSQVKVREATSNDPWGPSSSLMTEIADFTYNVVAFSEIMAMIWKRLNDHGKNWRHVYKSLVVLEYIIKTGSERVAQQCKENIFAIQTLKDFQFIDRDGKDQGVNVREKSKMLVSLLKDDERLKQERARALKAKERFAQASSGIGSDSQYGGSGGSGSGGGSGSSKTETDDKDPTGGTQTDNAESSTFPSSSSPASGEMEQARPQTSGEEELQLQLALAMSKEEADEAERQKRSDDVRLQMALNESMDKPEVQAASAGTGGVGPSLLELNEPVPLPTADPWASEPVIQEAPVADAWGAPAVAPVVAPAADPWGSQPATQSRPAPPQPSDPWSSPASSQPVVPPSDPWGSSPPPPASSDLWDAPVTSTNMATTQASPWGDPTIDQDDDFDSLRTGTGNGDIGAASSAMPPNNYPFDLSGMNAALSPMSLEDKKKSASDFLGENSSLVNLDSLIGPTPQQQVQQSSTNPFAVNTTSKATNPFQQQSAASPTLNQMRAPPTMVMQTTNNNAMGSTGMGMLPQPLLPASEAPPPQQQQQSTNPFLL